MKILLQHKTFVGYILLMAIIGSMVAIVLHSKKIYFPNNQRINASFKEVVS